MGTLCRGLSPIGVELFLAFGTLAPFPLYEGLNALPTGHWLEAGVDSNSTTLELDWGKTFWEIEPTEVPGSYDQAVERYGELFLASIEETLEGACLLYTSDAADE